MYYKLNNEDYPTSESKAYAIYTMIYTALSFILLAGLFLSYFLNYDSFKIFVIGILTLYAINFTTIAIRIIKSHKGYWFILATLLEYIDFTGVYLILYLHTSNWQQSFIYTFIAALAFDTISTFIQERLGRE